jgi:ABC-type Fe3+/spermidine/putrescine transport system ATPase subunit
LSALEALLAKCTDDAQRVVMLREALELEKAEHLATCRRWIQISDGQKKAIARARKLMREMRGVVGPGDLEHSLAYEALHWSRR